MPLVPKLLFYKLVLLAIQIGKNCQSNHLKMVDNQKMFFSSSSRIAFKHSMPGTISSSMKWIAKSKFFWKGVFTETFLEVHFLACDKDLVVYIIIFKLKWLNISMVHNFEGIIIPALACHCWTGRGTIKGKNSLLAI